MQKQSISNKIKIASFICTLMVVFRHSLNHIAFWNEWRGDLFAGFVEGGISILTQIAVPYFFLVSGFFFFKYSYYNSTEYLVMVRKKWNTLILPYLIWSTIGLIEQMAAREYAIDSLNKLLFDLLLSEWNGPLWYVRTLIIFMFVYPLYGWIFKINNLILYSIVIIILLYLWNPVDCGIFSSEGILFFFLGGVLHSYPFILEKKINKYFLLILSIVWIVFCFYQPLWSKVMSNITTIGGIIIFWNLIDYISTKYSNILLNLSVFSFFIYANHIYPLKAIKITFARLYPENETVALLTYFIAPCIIVLLFTYIGKFLKKKYPRIMFFLTGGRS